MKKSQGFCWFLKCFKGQMLNILLTLLLMQHWSKRQTICKGGKRPLGIGCCLQRRRIKNQEGLSTGKHGLGKACHIQSAKE